VEWVQWDARVLEDLAQRAAKRCVTRILRPKHERTGMEALIPTLPLTAAWMLRLNQGWSTLGQVLGRCAYPRLRNRCSSQLRARFQVMQCYTSGGNFGA
jgi:hypothetical protein